ncbi:MAG: glycosyltransferase family 2 protein [Armatimonadetes bacterium]|nr:glycosyltransferase family 2 protein [Armatimonadota bacterium]
MPLDLMVVMPVYNEEECIVDVVRSWRDQLSEMSLDFALLVLNDGSTDGTPQALQVFHNDARVRIVNKPNAGHGPTILQGYKIAVEEAEWVFQCDSDNEMHPEHFRKFWDRRERYDALFGVRVGREQNAARQILSGGSRVVVKLLFGRGVRDVNVPYRLMRSQVLEPIVAAIPVDTFAPNVLISGALARAKKRLWNAPVPHQNRATGAPSILRWKLWKAAFRSLRQTLFFQIGNRGQGTRDKAK